MLERILSRGFFRALNRLDDQQDLALSAFATFLLGGLSICSKLPGSRLVGFRP